MSAFAGVDLAVIREAVEKPGVLVGFELDRNLLGGQALVRITTTDPDFPRRKPKPLLPGPLVGDDHASLLRALADVVDGTIGSLVVTDPRDEIATCRACGCTDEDCSGCIERTGQPCSWVESDLCSACS